MEDSQPPEPIDPIEIELNLIQELVGDNIVLIIHKNGMTIMMDEDIEERTEEQTTMFSRIYVATRPSVVLTIFLTIEIWMLSISDFLDSMYEKYIKKS
jgi:hypothetical protein